MPEGMEAPLPKKQTPKSFWNQFSVMEWIAMASMVAYLVYLNVSTHYVPNIAINETRVINGVTYLAGQALYLPSYFVPSSNVSNTQTFFGVVLYAGTLIILLQRRLNENRRATIEEAINDIARQIIKVRNLRDARIVPQKDGLRITSEFEIIDLDTKFLTRYKSRGDTREAFQYVIQAKIYNRDDEVWVNQKVFYHPWSRYWDGMVKSDRPLNESDKCQWCGKAYDEKIIGASDIQALRFGKGFIGGRI